MHDRTLARAGAEGRPQSRRPHTARAGLGSSIWLRANGVNTTYYTIPYTRWGRVTRWHQQPKQCRFSMRPCAFRSADKRHTLQAQNSYGRPADTPRLWSRFSDHRPRRFNAQSGQAPFLCQGSVIIAQPPRKMVSSKVCASSKHRQTSP